jgi:hypothetical protein
MSLRTYRVIARAAPIAAGLLAGTLSLATPAGATLPPSASEYRTLPVCHAPASGNARCLAMALAPRTAAARARTRSRGTARDGAVGMAASAAECALIFPACLTPTDLNDAYFPGESPAAPASEPQTIALVDAYNDPSARLDLETYEKAFGLNKCPAAQSSCFEQVNQKGETTNLPFPASEAAREAELAICENPSKSTKTREKACADVKEAEGWAVEISTDIEVARAVCQNCKVLLVEASTSSYANLETAEETAVALKPTEISNSWGGEEPTTDSRAFDHPGIPITAAAGDGGYFNWTENAEATEAGAEPYVGPDYPASSPHVIAVGGTRLTLSNGAWHSETVWNDAKEGLGAGGSGCSARFEAQTWQREVPDWSNVGCEDWRAVADVSADGDPDSGVAVYDSVPSFSEEEGKLVNTPLYWWPIGGTSVASPIIASMFALAGGAHGVEYPAKTLYSHLGSKLLHEVTAGGNGECDDLYASSCTGSMNPLSARFAFDCGAGILICNAAPGYNGPTGVGAPDGVVAFQPESEAEHTKKVEEEAKKAEEQRRIAEEKKKAEESKGSSEGTGTTSNQPKAAASGGALTASAPSGGSSQPQSTAALVPTLSALTLTKTATAALSHGTRPKASQLAFAFTLNVAARIRVKLAKLIITRGHKRWQTLPYSLTIASARGRDSAHLSAHATLAPGRYRLTLAPLHGTARTLTFRVG